MVAPLLITMRTRTKSSILSKRTATNFGVVIKRKGDVNYINYANWTPNSFVSGIQDEIMIDDPSPSKKCKFCDHIVKSIQLLDCPITAAFNAPHFAGHLNPKGEVWTPQYGNGPWWWFVQSSDNNPPAANVMNTPYDIVQNINNRQAVKVVYEKTPEQLLVSAAGEMYNSNEVNTLLNIYESPQLIQTLSSILTFITERKSLLRSMNLAAGLHLGYSFGVAPLVSDLKKMSNLFRKPGRLENLLRQKNILRIVRKTSGGYSLPDYPSDMLGYHHIDPGVGTPNGSYWHPYPSVRGAASVTATVVGRRDFSIENSTLRGMDNLLSKYGMAGPASFAWELVPWSFVVDWFVDTSHVLGKLNNVLTGNSWSIHDKYVTSVTELVTPMVHHRRSVRFNWPQYENSTVGSLRYYRYTRNPKVQIPLSAPSGRFGNKQAGLSLSLLYQIVAKCKSVKWLDK